MIQPFIREAEARLNAVSGYSEALLVRALGGLVGMSEQPYSAVELPNLYVMVLDILARVFERSGVVRRFEIMALHDMASRAHHECSITHHDGSSRDSTAPVK